MSRIERVDDPPLRRCFGLPLLPLGNPRWAEHSSLVTVIYIRLVVFPGNAIRLDTVITLVSSVCETTGERIE